MFRHIKYFIVDSTNSWFAKFAKPVNNHLSKTIDRYKKDGSYEAAEVIRNIGLSNAVHASNAIDALQSFNFTGISYFIGEIAKEHPHVGLQAILALESQKIYNAHVIGDIAASQYHNEKVVVLAIETLGKYGHKKYGHKQACEEILKLAEMDFTSDNLYQSSVLKALHEIGTQDALKCIRNLPYPDDVILSALKRFKDLKEDNICSINKRCNLNSAKSLFEAAIEPTTLLQTSDTRREIETTFFEKLDFLLDDGTKSDGVTALKTAYEKACSKAPHRTTEETSDLVDTAFPKEKPVPLGGVDEWCA